MTNKQLVLILCLCSGGMVAKADIHEHITVIDHQGWVEVSSDDIWWEDNGSGDDFDSGGGDTSTGTGGTGTSATQVPVAIMDCLPEGETMSFPVSAGSTMEPLNNFSNSSVSADEATTGLWGNKFVFRFNMEHPHIDIPYRMWVKMKVDIDGWENEDGSDFSAENENLVQEYYTPSGQTSDGDFCWGLMVEFTCNDDSRALSYDTKRVNMRRFGYHWTKEFLEALPDDTWEMAIQYKGPEYCGDTISYSSTTQHCTITTIQQSAGISLGAITGNSTLGFQERNCLAETLAYTPNSCKMGWVKVRRNYFYYHVARNYYDWTGEVQDYNDQIVREGRYEYYMEAPEWCEPGMGGCN